MDVELRHDEGGGLRFGGAGCGRQGCRYDRHHEPDRHDPAAAQRWPSGLDGVVEAQCRRRNRQEQEEADDVRALLAEAIRVLTPAGRIILVAAARGGLWARAESTPFGHGRPFTRRQLEKLVREVGLEPAAWSQTLYVPPWPTLYGMADGFEKVGRRVVPGAAGLILLEATRHAYARVQPVGAAERVPLRGAALQPSPAGRGVSRALAQPDEHA